MNFFPLFCVFLILVTKEIVSAPLEDVTITQNDVTQEDKPETTEKNPVQEWFESLSKNVTTNTQNAMNNIKDWFTKMAEHNQNGVSQSLPTMYMGSFQLLKMPMPQISDVVKGMGDLATAAQTVNKLTG